MLLLALACAGCAAKPPALAPATAPAAPAVQSAGLATPVHVRSCCVFGQRLASGTSAPWPGFESDNLRGVGDLGPHGYDAGLVSLAGDGHRRAADERNGLVYTCRGGFIDVAQARDSADMTAFLAAAIEPRLETGGAIALADDGGTRYVLVHAVDKSRIEVRGKRALAADVAGWLAFQIAVWREIVEWYGGGWAGRVAAFSPEDAYSSLFGIGLAQQIVRGGEHDTAASFERAMNNRLPGALAALGAVSADAARAAMQAVDGRVWNSQRAASDAGLVLRRRFDVWDTQIPWLACNAYKQEKRCPFRDCGARPTPEPLDNPAASGGLEFAAVATLEIEVDGTLAKGGFPFPRDDSDTITQAEFPAIVETIRRTDHHEGTKGTKAF